MHLDTKIIALCDMETRSESKILYSGGRFEKLSQKIQKTEKNGANRICKKQTKKTYVTYFK